MRTFIVLAACALLSACVTDTEQTGPEMVWRKASLPKNLTAEDRQRIIQQFEIDRTICEGEMHRANLSSPTVSVRVERSGPPTVGQAADDLAATLSDIRNDEFRRQSLNTIFKGCMYQRGYVYSPKLQAVPLGRGNQKPPE